MTNFANLIVSGSDPVEAALSFYKALKVYPQPRDLIPIYDKTVPKVSPNTLNKASYSNNLNSLF